MAGKFGELTLFEPLVKESLANYRSDNKLFIVSTNLNGFSLVNHGRFAMQIRQTFPYQTFPLYGSSRKCHEFVTFTLLLYWLYVTVV